MAATACAPGTARAAAEEFRATLGAPAPGLLVELLPGPLRVPAPQVRGRRGGLPDLHRADAEVRDLLLQPRPGQPGTGPGRRRLSRLLPGPRARPRPGGGPAEPGDPPLRMGPLSARRSPTSSRPSAPAATARRSPGSITTSPWPIAARGMSARPAPSWRSPHASGPARRGCCSTRNREPSPRRDRACPRRILAPPRSRAWPDRILTPCHTIERPPFRLSSWSEPHDEHLLRSRRFQASPADDWPATGGGSS